MSLARRISKRLDDLVAGGGFHHAFVCTDGGLLVAGDGGELQDHLASVVSLMDSILERARRDLDRAGIDEVTLLDRSHGRIIIRPIVSGQGGRMFLVVSAPADASWRKATNATVKALSGLLVDLVTS